MRTPLRTLRIVAVAATLTAAAALAGTANAASTDGPITMLTANFATRQVVQVEVGDFHFKPGQVAPVHTHEAPAVGYVAKGMIIYQVEGGKPQILKAGDAFFEPVGPRILRFDNASATEEAIFIDFNLEQAGEPFIVFEKPLTEDIDRRTLPTIALQGQSISQAEISSNELKPAGTIKLQHIKPTLGLVAEGVVEIRIDGQAVQRIVAGGTFALPKAGPKAILVNASPEVKANVITFRLN